MGKCFHLKTSMEGKNHEDSMLVSNVPEDFSNPLELARYFETYMEHEGYKSVRSKIDELLMQDVSIVRSLHMIYASFYQRDDIYGSNIYRNIYAI
jgi:hypothetical protein